VSQYTEENEKLCGDVRDIAWDYTGNRFVVLFKNSPLIAVYMSSLQNFSLSPMGYIRPAPNLIPLHISFKPNFPRGALLSVGFDTGKISLYPFYFNS